MGIKTLIRRMAVVTTLLTPCLSHAYVGPGAGLSAIGSVLALIGATLLLIVGFVWYPIKRLLKRRKASQSSQESRDDSSSNSESG